MRLLRHSHYFRHRLGFRYSLGFRHSLGLWVAVLLCITDAGCTSRRVDLEDEDTRSMVELLMPQRFRIVEAFTGFRSFDDDELPDGIELLFQPLDAYGDPVKIAGSVRVELFAHQAASGFDKGRRICEPWQIDLLTSDDQERYWNVITGMYEVPLEFPAGTHPEGSRYVLALTYNTPLGEHMTSDCELSIR